MLNLLMAFSISASSLRLAFLEITFFTVSSIEFCHLTTKVKRQWARLELGWVTISGVGQVWDVSDSELAFVTKLS